MHVAYNQLFHKRTLATRKSKMAAISKMAATRELILVYLWIYLTDSVDVNIISYIFSNVEFIYDKIKTLKQPKRHETMI